MLLHSFKGVTKFVTELIKSVSSDTSLSKVVVTVVTCVDDDSNTGSMAYSLACLERLNFCMIPMEALFFFFGITEFFYDFSFG